MTTTSLRGKNAVITGSTSGIGLGIAEVFAAQGINVVLNGFGDAAAVEQTRADLAARSGVKVLYNGADMSQPEAVRNLIASTEKELGSVDILVNNAGIQHVEAIESFPTAKWDAILAINLSSNFHSIAAALPGMKKRNWGRIINVASAHGLTASPFKSAYVAAKHGQVGLGKVVALEVAEMQITCNTICPGYVLTPLVEKQIPDQMKVHNKSREDVIRDVLLARQPSKRFTTVQELGETALFLCTDAASNITGTTLSLDGGWTAL